MTITWRVIVEILTNSSSVVYIYEYKYIQHQIVSFQEIKQPQLYVIEEIFFTAPSSVVYLDGLLHVVVAGAFGRLVDVFDAQPRLVGGAG